MPKHQLIAQQIALFEEKFVDWRDGTELQNNIGSLKSFLTTALSEAYEAGEKQRTINIGMLRQWLNEDRITEVEKMVTDEMLNKFLK